MEYQKILMWLLSKAYKLDDGKIAEILKAENATESDVIKAILAIDTERVSKLKEPKEGETFQDGYAKAKKEVLTDLEKSLKSTHGIESDKKGVELIDEIILAKSKSTGKEGEITEDIVKKHPVFTKMEKDFKKQLEEKDTELQNKSKEYESKIGKIETFTNVKAKAEGIFNSLKPILSKNSTIATNLKNQFYKDLENYDFEKQADGSFIVLKDGKRLEDNHGHGRDFEEIVKSIAGNYFEFEENNGGSNAGNNNDNDKNKPDIANIKSEADAVKIANDETIPLADRLKAVEDYNKANGLS